MVIEYLRSLPPKRTLDPANDTVLAGRYDATTLHAVDADLAVGNIKSGVTIFGVAGAATVQDISTADAAVGEVLNPKTFFSVTGGIKTGTMPTVAITAANDNYPAGYHAGNVGGLDAIDLDLASANIKSGVTIFGKAGAATVQEIGAADAAVTDVKAPRTFFSVTGGIKTGTLATVALDPAANSYPAGYHAGAASLTAVDADLAAGNIKSGVTIFGVLGTFVSTLAQDIVASAVSARTCTNGQAAYSYYPVMNAGADLDLATTTPNFAAGSLAVGVGFTNARCANANCLKFRLYMNGVQVAESGYLGTGDYALYILIATAALSGAKIVKCLVHNYSGSPTNLDVLGTKTSGDPAPAGVAVGSVKIV